MTGAGHSHGRRDGDVLVIVFPYQEGNFRDTFTRHPEAGTWSLLLESQKGDGTWPTFARYELVPVKAH